MPPNGKIDFALIQTNRLADTPAPIDLSLSLFSGDGHSVTVNLIVPGLAEAKPVHRNVIVTNLVTPLQLSVSNRTNHRSSSICKVGANYM